VRILIVRLDGVGDALACAPLVAALRAAGHTLGIALSTRNADVYAPGVFAATHVLERIPWPAHGTTPASWAPALAAARAMRYDAALVVSEEPDAYRFARAAGIARRTGFVNGWERPLKTLGVIAAGTRPVVRGASLARENAHECAIVFRLAAGYTAERAPTTDLARLRPLLLGEAAAAAERSARAPVAIQCTTKWRDAGVDDATFLAVVAAVTRGHAAIGLVPAAEADAVAPLAARAGIATTIFADAASWERAIANAAALVTPDTGAVHVAGCVGTPAVCVWPDGDLVARRIARWRPWAAPSRHVVVRASDEVAGNVARELGELVGIS
jgi:ADP-heptose:LPS heptosyltransferase